MVTTGPNTHTHTELFEEAPTTDSEKDAVVERRHCRRPPPQPREAGLRDVSPPGPESPDGRHTGEAARRRPTPAQPTPIDQLWLRAATTFPMADYGSAGEALGWLWPNR